MSIEADKKQAVAKRGIIKGKIKRFQSYLDKHTPDIHLEEFNSRYSVFKPILSEFDDIQEKIDIIEGTDSSAERDEFENQYHSLCSRAEIIIKEFYSENNTLKNTSSHTSTTETAPVPVRLPTISLPLFSGKYDQWMSFYDTFISLIDKNESLSDVQKLQYLKSSLRDQAAQTIQNIELTAANYSVALDLLKRQFHNTRIIVQNHIKLLFELPQTQKDKPNSLRHIVNSTYTHLRAIDNLNVNIDNWDPIIIHLITTKLDTVTHREWELSTQPNKLPTLTELTDFLEKRSQTLETVNSNKGVETHPPLFQQKYKHKFQPKLKSHLAVNEPRCSFCNGNHLIYFCTQFKQTPESEKLDKLIKARVCINCLRSNHTVQQCKSPTGCKHCGKRHHSMLHTASSQPKTQYLHNQASLLNQGENDSKHADSKITLNSTVTNAASGNGEVLLSTALVQIISPHGTQMTCRAFLDSGSQSNFISESLCQSLQLKKNKSSIVVTGISEGTALVSSMVTATVKSLTSDHVINTQFLVLPKITGLLPTSPVDTSSWQIPNNIPLADPTFAKPGKIDVLLGQEHFFSLLDNGRIEFENMPILQNTKLGWVIGGKSHSSTSSSISTKCHLNVIDRIDQQLQKFWKLEETSQIKAPLTHEENLCERHYIKSVQRAEDGRFTVTMPLKEDPCKLGSSLQTAEKRFFQVEKRLNRQPELKAQYVEFMREYEQLGHMERVKGTKTDDQSYFLPHHPVVKESSSTTKLRVVFDASAKTSNNISLNDIMMIGPKIQDDLFSILIRFRTHIYVLSADIEKMYRQIWIEPKQRQLLQIVWRENPEEELRTYQLNTVTYGTACAPYLAIKTLQKLADDESLEFPEAAEVIMKDFYVDDLLTGTDSLEEGMKLQRDIIEVLRRGGFNLRKWNSNNDELLENLARNHNEPREKQISSNDTTIKTLGLLWNAKDDSLQFTSQVDPKTAHGSTKRSILSQIARLFDPLGLVSPIVIRAKIILQELWKTKLDWDDQLPKHLHEKWLNFRQCLITLDNMQVPRSTVNKQPGGTIELHGFSDASEQAYGGAVYIKHINTNDKSQVRLLCSKSRVAPLKTISLPRLELCGALLLSELMSQVQKALGSKVAQVYFWTDSTIVLSWISSEAARWKTFVANRVAKIHDLSSPKDWRHVQSEDNPADLVSRGTTAKLLHQSQLWWHGPRWLTERESEWPTTTLPCSKEEVIHEERMKKEVSAVSLTHKNSSYIDNVIRKFSSYQKLQRVIAFCLRFIHNCRDPHRKLSGPLSPKEISVASNKLLLAEQASFFSEERACLINNQTLPRKSKLIALSPFIDSSGLIRVGGRLNNSDIRYNAKHPIVLHNKSHLTNLIAINEHKRHLHAGPQALLAAVRQNYWPLGARNLVRRIVHQCVICFKAKPKTNQQVMGSLPSQRTSPTRPFYNCGVDYCGPVHIKSGNYKTSKLIKSYIAVFVCFSTKAIHLELTSDLSTESFLAAFRRFTARRGLCSQIYSDNGTNFVGANNELKELYKLIKSDEHQQKIKDSTSQQNINWHFIPPNSPHFGGLWEAGVKSVKYHLRRVVGNANLTFEEMYTTLTMVEACLNSRPLTFLSTDPNDPQPLTPGHFLIGEALTSLPDVDLTSLPMNRLSRWQRCQQIAQHFWGRWSKEYLSQLQQRQKWTVSSIPIQPGQVVLIREDNLPPLKWVTAVVENIHPGADGRTRVATVKTPSGLFKRAINRLCPLPIDN
jgi:hypothetical protein